MRRILLRWFLPAAVIALAGFGVWYATRPEQVAVMVRPVEMGRVARTVANTRAGTVNACRRARLSPSIGGQIAVLPIREGDRVRTGQLLLELWNRDLLAEQVLAEKEVATAQARAKASCVNAQKAQREAGRMLKLVKKGAASEDDTDAAVTQAQAMAADCDAAKASVATGEARIEVIRANLQRTRLTAPFDGIVAEINGELSEFVTPSPIGVATPPAVDLIDATCFYVTAPIDEVDAAGIRVGMPAVVTLDAFGDRRLPGKVRRIAPYVLDREKQARTVDVEVSFDRSEDLAQLLAGYSADVEIILEVRESALRVPAEAVMDGKDVFVFQPAEKRIRKREIRAGLTNWDYAEVLGGLAAGDQVVVNVDRSTFKDGAAARLSEAAP